MNQNNSIISVNKLSKSYFLGKNTVEVLRDISLAIKSGEYVAIMGQSGAGKSTLLNILGCLDAPTCGEYYFKNKSISSFSPSALAEIRNKEIGFVFQNFNLLPKLDVFGNVELPLIYQNISRKKRKKLVEDVLNRFGLFDRRKHKPNEISGGQKQRVAIARAIVKNPSIILADEPTGNLDSATTDNILNVFDELHEEGNTILIITHEKSVADKTQRLIHLVDGTVVK